MNELFFNVIKKPLITEKGSGLTASFNQYVFEVDLRAKRPDIKKAVEALFKVKVKKVRTLISRGKIKTFRQHSGKQPNTKKAYVTLAEGNKIELIPGV